MLRRTFIPAVVVVLLLAAGRAEAVTVRDVIELSKAGLGDAVLLALIDVDRPVFSIDAGTLKTLKAAGVSETVIVAMIHSGRAPLPVENAPVAPEPDPASAPEPSYPEPRYPEPGPSAPVPPVSVPVPYPVPVAMPVYVPVPIATSRGATINTTIQTDDGSLVKARVPVPPNCVKAEPVYWGFGGKLRPGSWDPGPTIVCR